MPTASTSLEERCHGVYKRGRMKYKIRVINRTFSNILKDFKGLIFPLVKLLLLLLSAPQFCHYYKISSDMQT
jgi:hypothetical protein